MKILNSIIDFLRLNEDDKKIFVREFSPENTKRVFYLSAIGALNSIIQIFVFFLRMPGASEVEYKWRMGIITIHSAISFLLLFNFFHLFFTWFRKKKTGLISAICINIMVFVLLAGGATTASVDQMVTSSITPFLLTSMIAAMVLIVRPVYAILYYSMAYLLFHFMIGIFQPNEAIVLSNRVNGLTATIIGLLLSFFLWSGNLIRYRQKYLIEKQNSDLKEAALSRDKFFSIIAHDLKSPLTTILGFLDVMKTSLEKNETEKSKQYHQIIQDSTKQTLTLLENLLEWSRSQTGRLKYEPALADLEPVIRERIISLSSSLLSKNLKIEFRPGEKSIAYADPEMIKTVIRNLLTNAIKFSYPDSVIEVETKTMGNHLHIFVRDHGTGIPDDKVGLLFNLDTTPVTPGTAQEHGTGLGLILCKEIIDKHRGTISVKSNKETGTVFSFSLPLSKI